MKRSGAREPFQVAKLRGGLENALADRPAALEALDGLVIDIERALVQEGPLVDSDQIGRAVLEHLRDIDEVAYLRFASVYKEFQGASDFEREMAAMEETEPA